MRDIRGSFLAAALAAVAWGCGSAELPAGSAPPAAVEAETAVAAVGPVAQVTRLTGSIEPWARTSPGTKIMGRIQEVRAREGDRVEKGGLLARLESRDLEAGLEQARAGVAMAEANLENASAQFERITQLHERGSVTDKNLEDATAFFHSAEAGVRQARANQAAAEVMLGYAEIRSPIAGYVTARRAEPGDMAAPGMPLFSVDDLAKVKVIVRVPEGIVPSLAEGGEATIEIDALAEEFAARIDRVIPSGDPRSRTFDVRFVLDNPGGRLKGGMFARARFERGTSPAMRIPEGAVVVRGQLQGVFVVGEDGVARLRWVRLGRAEEGQVEVLSGIEAGERYLPAPPPGLADGTPIRGR